MVAPSTMPLASCCSSVVTFYLRCTAGVGWNAHPRRVNTVRSAAERAGHARPPLATGDLVDGQHLVRAVAVLVERDRAGRALLVVLAHVGDQVSALAVVPGAAVERGRQRADDRVGRVEGERAVGGEALLV